MEDERFGPIDALTERKQCSKCGRKRLYFCYDCHIYTPGVSSLAPTVQIDVIKHPRELNSKSTAVHCVLLAPCQARLFSSEDPEVPDYGESDRLDTVLVYPDDKAMSIKEFVEQTEHPLKRLVFLDSTWNNVEKLRRMPQLQKLPKVSLNAYKTEYWRPQKNYPDECLATIEAIFYAVKEAWQAENPEEKYANQFDDMLFWFRFFKSKFINSKE